MAQSRDEHRKAVRSQIQASIEAAEQERKREMFRRRIELARNGVKLYHEKKWQQAVMAMTTYLRILEEYHGVGEGGLMPDHFDRKVDLPELLLISGIYWDLAKLYDRTATEAKLKDFRLYLQKYVQFSKGMPFATLSAETMRKYIAVEKPRHRAEFKSAYKQLVDTRCFIATSLVDLCDEPTLPALRRFRDERLAATAGGRAVTRVYYALGPAVAATLDRSPARVRTLAARSLDRLAARLGR
jgi:hypothetical protein